MENRFEVGMYAEEKRKITLEMVLAYAEVSGDHNPIHVDAEYARNSIFGGQIAHGMLGASMFSKLLGEDMPGNGTIYMAQDLKFLKPVYIGDEICARVTIEELLEKGRARISTVVDNQKGERVIEGSALVKLPR